MWRELVAYDAGTVEKVRRILSTRSDVVEKGMIGGGLGFLVDGNLCCGVSSRGLTIRVGPEDKASALTEPHVQPLVLGKRETAAFVVVQPDGFKADAELQAWIDRAVRFVDTLRPREGE